MIRQSRSSATTLSPRLGQPLNTAGSRQAKTIQTTAFYKQQAINRYRNIEMLPGTASNGELLNRINTRA